SAKEAGLSDPSPLCSSLRSDCDFDSIGLGILPPRQPDRQYTSLVFGADLAGIDLGRQCERPRERAITAFDAMERLLRDFRVELLFATQRQRVVFNRQLDLLFLHVRQLRLQDQVVPVAVNVDDRYPRAPVEV